MNLTEEQQEHIQSKALSYIDRPYAPDFRCVDFVREVYRVIGIEIPKLRDSSPPIEFNISEEELIDPPLGHLMFLKDRRDPRKYRTWTHVVIIFPNNNCIHCSLFAGKVCIASIPDLMSQRYDFAPSATA